jgi:hypothetical protein
LSFTFNCLLLLPAFIKLSTASFACIFSLCTLSCLRLPRPCISEHLSSPAHPAYELNISLLVFSCRFLSLTIRVTLCASL